MFKLVIDKELCIGCSNCVVACPYSAATSPESGHGFGVSEHTMKIVDGIVEFKGRCSGCGVCLPTCPTDAIKIVREDKKDEDDT